MQRICRTYGAVGFVFGDGVINMSPLRGSEVGCWNFFN